MPIVLAKRDPNATEMMDDTRCDQRKLHNTYHQFRVVNAFLSRSKSVYRRWLKPAMRARPQQAYSLLDIGFGGGDIAMKMAAWAKKDGFDLQVTGIEVDQRAYDYVRGFDWPDNVVFRLADVHDLAIEGERFDFVISNHMVHHLDHESLYKMLDNAAQIARQLVLFVDLRRSDIAYYSFAMGTLPFFRDSYIRDDGLTSLRRSYTINELRMLAPAHWSVTRLFPFRMILSYVSAPSR